MGGIITFSTICVAFLVYALFSGIPTLRASEFVLMSRSAHTRQYSDTTVAYSLQVAITIYFIVWGYQYGLSNLAFIATWFMGLGAFALATPLLSRFLVSNGENASLFAFLSEGSNSLQKYMATLFSISLIGLLFTEIFFSSKLVESLAEVESAAIAQTKPFFWTSFAFVLLIVLMYASLGGMRKVVTTDTWQLAIAYIGSALLITGLSPQVAEHGGAVAFHTIYMCMPLLYLGLALMPAFVRIGQKQDSHGIFRDMTFVTFIGLITSAIISITPLLIITPSANRLVIFPKAFGTMLNEPWGWAPMVGYTLINVIWQFSDYTAYHRLSLLELPSDEKDRNNKIRESIIVTMLNSPLSWGLGIFAGMTIYAAGIVAPMSQDIFGDAVTAIAKGAVGSGVSDNIAEVGLAAFIASVMLSTVDSGFMSIVLIAIRDFKRSEMSPYTRFLLNVTVILTMLAFALIQEGFKIDIFVFLNATYSWGLLFGTMAILRMCGMDLPLWKRAASCSLGAIASAYITIEASALPYLAATVAPSVVAILVSGALFVPEILAVVSSSIKRRRLTS